MSVGKVFSLAYGSGALEVAPLGRFTALAAPALPALADPAAALLTALDDPIEAPPLASLVRPGDRVTIVVSDKTRVTGIRTLLPPLLAYLERAGVPAVRVRLLFALGIHQAQTAAERAAIVGEDVVARVANADHDCDDTRTLETLTTEGPAVGVRLSRQVLDGDLVVVTGAVGFHYLAGFGGGRKALLPGVAGRESVRAFHSRSLSAEAGAGRHPRVASGVREGNPLDALAKAAAACVPRTFLVNTIMAPGQGAGAIAALFVGDVEAAFARACAEYRARFTVPIDTRRPVVIVSAGGAPRDCDLVQAQKAIGAGAAALAPGGMMLVLAACAGGAGQQELLRWFTHPDRATHVAALRAGFSVPGQTALALREHAERARVYLLSELPPETVRATGMIPITRVEDFLAEAARCHGSDALGYVLPDGARYLPSSAAA